MKRPFSTKYCNLAFLHVFYFLNYIIFPKALATPNAAAAAATPIKVTFMAPIIAGWPVTLLLKNPKIKRQMVVSTEEYNNPS